jgi:hypothetical protein
MIIYSKFSPTPLDLSGLGCEDKQDWLVAPCGVNRDSGTLYRANWKAQVKMLNDVDADGNDHEIHRFGHWGNGWFEIILVRPNTECFTLCKEAEDALSDYPVLCEETFSQEETDDIQEYWKQLSVRERIGYINKANNVSIFASRRDDVPEGMDEHLRGSIY